MAHHRFEETQRFNQPWLWIVIVGVSLLVIVQVPISLIYAAGEDPLPTSSILAIIFSLVFAVGLNALFIYSRLITRIDKNGVGITFKPFFNKEKIIRWAEVEKVFVRKYKPLWEYGGWGIRNRWNSKAYNTSGNIGLQLILKTGKKVLIGTQESEEMESFLKKCILTDSEINKNITHESIT